jgi:hypothetical protein
MSNNKLTKAEMLDQATKAIEGASVSQADYREILSNKEWQE